MRCWPRIVAIVAVAAQSIAQSEPRPKLLYPVMIQGGPNNQYQQFLESMLLAKALRRRVVLAPFLSWPGGGDQQRTHAFADTFDVAEVNRFVSFVAVKDVGAQGTAIVTAGGARFPARRHLSQPRNALAIVCSMAGLRGGWCDGAPAATPLLTPATRQRCRAREKTWGSYASCLGEPFVGEPVLGAALWASLPALYGGGALTTPRTLEAVRALRRAPRVRAAAAKLRAALFGDRPYLCAHLRRVENAQRCRDGGSSRAPQVSCSPATPGYVATRRLAETLRAAAAAARVADVYVARVAKVKRQAAWPFRGEGVALLGFLRNASGPAVASASADVGAAIGDATLDGYGASLVEQELCERAAAFVGTADSTWTSLVAHQRFARGEYCSTSFEQLLSRQPRLNLNMPQTLVAADLLARGVEDFRARCAGAGLGRGRGPSLGRGRGRARGRARGRGRGAGLGRAHVTTRGGHTRTVPS